MTCVFSIVMNIVLGGCRGKSRAEQLSRPHSENMYDVTCDVVLTRYREVRRNWLKQVGSFESSSSSTNFMATQVSNKTSGPQYFILNILMHAQKYAMRLQHAARLLLQQLVQYLFHFSVSHVRAALSNRARNSFPYGSREGNNEKTAKQRACCGVNINS